MCYVCKCVAKIIERPEINEMLTNENSMAIYRMFVFKTEIISLKRFFFFFVNFSCFSFHSICCGLFKDQKL